MMKKILWTLNTNGYSKEITNITYPLLKHYAKKIGAEFRIISERKFPEWPVTYEKLQIHELAQTHQADWHIYLDSDAIVHPEMIDWTCFLKKDTVAHCGTDMAAIRWRYDQYFLRDSRNIGSCNWCTIASDWCIDLWKPVEDLTPAQAIENIYPTVDELNTVITSDHLIDDYILSRNIARYGLKVKTLVDLQKEINLPNANFFWHAYTVSLSDKLVQMQQVIDNWKLGKFNGNR